MPVSWSLFSRNLAVRYVFVDWLHLCLFAHCQLQPTDALMVTLMGELDKDGNGLVEFPEFLHGMDFLNTLSTEETSPRQ